MSVFNPKIREFLNGNKFAVAGASEDREKYGNKVLRAYLQNELNVVPVNPHSETIEGRPVASSLIQIPDEVDSVSIVTPPNVTELVVKQAIAKGVRNIWMQPGAESNQAIQLAEAAGLNVIADGPCVLVALRYKESDKSTDA